MVYHAVKKSPLSRPAKQMEINRQDTYVCFVL